MSVQGTLEPTATSARVLVVALASGWFAAAACIGDARRSGGDTTADVAEEVLVPETLVDTASETDDGPEVSEPVEVVDATETVDPLDVVETTEVEEVGDTQPETMEEIVGDAFEVDDGEIAETIEDVFEAEVTDAEVVEIVDVEIVEAEIVADAIEVEATPECGGNADCSDREGADECTQWTCRAGTCVLAPNNEGGPCNDRDACTTGDKCRAGECVASGAVSCPADAGSFGCKIPVCDPLVGCTFIAATPDVSCNNGTGAIPGTCMLGGFQGGDHCDGQGACIDASAPTPATIGAPQLEGEWFLAYTTFGRYAALASGRGVATMTKATQEFALGEVHDFGIIPFQDDDAGFLCGLADGTLEARFPAGRLTGHQVDRNLAVLSDHGSDGLALLVRADDGDAADVDGSYAYFQTSVVFGRSTPSTWRGDVVFADGCMQSGTIASDPDDSVGYGFLPTEASCFVQSPLSGEESLYQLQVGVRAVTNDPNIYPIYYRGAVMKGGDVVVLVKETGEGSLEPEYGLTILVRDDVTTFSQPQMVGSWRYNLHAKIRTEAPRRDVGSVVWSLVNTFSGGSFGTLDGTVIQSSGWGAINFGTSHFSQRVSLPTGAIYQTGVVAPSGKFAVGWLVEQPTNGTQPSVLFDTPSGGSMLLMLRP